MKALILHDDFLSFGAAWLLKIEESAPRVKIHYAAKDTVSLDRFSRAEIIFGAPEPNLLRHASSLKWLHLPTTDAEGYTNLSVYANRNVTLTKAGGVLGIPASEHALAMLLALARVLTGRKSGGTVECGQFEITGAAAVVVGLGSMGCEVARKLAAFGCKVLAVRRNIMDKPEFVDEIYSPRHLGQCLARASIVVGCLPVTAETRGLFGRDEFSAMRNNAVFINIGHGGTVNYQALADAIASGRLAGAGLDVFDPESLEASGPLRNMDNVIVTEGAARYSQKTEKRQARLFIELCARFSAGRVMYNLVDFFSGY